MHRKLLTILATLMLALGAAACGDGKSNDGGGGQSDAPVNTDTPGSAGDIGPTDEDTKRGEGE